MPGFCCGDRDPHSFWIAHLADNDDVGRLPQGCSQSSREIRCVHADFDLLDHTAQMGMLELEGVLNCDDVARLAPVDLVDQRSSSRGLARSRCSSDQDQSPGQARKSFHGSWKMKVLE